MNISQLWMPPDRPSPSVSPSMSPPVPPPVPPSGPVEDGPLGRLTRDPLGTVESWWRQANDLAAAQRVLLAAVTVTSVVVVLLGRRLLHRRRLRRLARGAQVIRIHPPPKADPHAAITWWSNLIGLLRPRWRRRVFGQPHLSFEYLWDGPELHLHVWVPGPIPAALVARAVEAAWPGARTSLLPSPLTTGGLVAEQAVLTAGTLRLARPDHHPLSTDHPADPLRPLLGAASGLSPGQRAVVQVLARPVTGRRLAAAHRAAAQLRGTHQPTLIGRLLDALTPGSGHHPARPGAVAAAHPERAGEIRAILDKATAPPLRRSDPLRRSHHPHHRSAGRPGVGTAAGTCTGLGVRGVRGP